jgi:hypothetical protein
MRVPTSHVLAAFVERGTASSASQTVPLPMRPRTALWILAGVKLAAALWIYAVHVHSLPCTTALCSIRNLGGRGSARASRRRIPPRPRLAGRGHRRFHRGGTSAVVGLYVLSMATFAAAVSLPWPRRAARSRLRAGPKRSEPQEAGHAVA